MELGSSDLILGVQWLDSLGGMHVNWQSLTMKFKLGDSYVTLQGEPGLCKSLVSLKSMLKVIRSEKEGVLIELCHATVEDPQDDEEIHKGLAALLHQFDEV